MSDEILDVEHNIDVGDIVTEIDYIIPPDRKPWIGIVMYIEKEHYELHSHLGKFEDLIGVYWFQDDCIETLPASVLELIQKAEKKG
jgi:hypothetical protein